MPYTGDGRKANTPKSGLVSWFGSNAAASPDSTPTRLRSNTAVGAADPSTPKNNVASRFMSALSSRFTPVSTSPIVDDDLCSLNIEAALFPPGSPSDRDSFSPAAFKNLQMNALGLLTKMQNAYRDRVAALQEIQAEKLAQREELEEAETRARHLRSQLEGMARKAQEQEKQMQRLMEELAAERKARVDERLAAERLISAESSMLSEDLGVDEDRRRGKLVRKSGDTIKSEAGFETDEESAESESVFSRCRSPTVPVHQEGGTMADGVTPVQSSRNSSALAPPRLRAGYQQQPATQRSAFQKIIKGISGETEDPPAREFRNSSSMAWDTVSMLRDENKYLKQRIGELEVAVEGALDLVNGIGL